MNKDGTPDALPTVGQLRLAEKLNFFEVFSEEDIKRMLLGAADALERLKRIEAALLEIAHENRHIRHGMDLLYIWMTVDREEWDEAKKIQPDNDQNVANGFNDVYRATKAIDAILEPFATDGGG